MYLGEFRDTQLLTETVTEQLCEPEPKKPKRHSRGSKGCLQIRAMLNSGLNSMACRVAAGGGQAKPADPPAPM
jgi:hypothetical protein